MDAAVDFYVTPLVQSGGVSWLVCKNALSHCVGIQDDIIAATAQAIQMAQYHAANIAAQVHVRNAESAAWRTVWCSPNVTPRFA